MALAPILLQTPADQTERLVERLLEMREELIDKMRRRGAIEPGYLPLISGIHATLEALRSGGGIGPARADRGVNVRVGFPPRADLRRGYQASDFIH